MERKKVLGIIIVATIVGVLVAGIIIGGLLIFGIGRDRAVPAGYMGSDEYCEDGFMDYTDYCKYYYAGDADAIFAGADIYKEVRGEDVEKIKGYFQNCRSWMEAQGRGADFDFDPGCVSTGDYVYIDTREGQERTINSVYGEYDAYSIYLYDTGSHTLYYVHNNG